MQHKLYKHKFYMKNLLVLSKFYKVQFIKYHQEELIKSTKFILIYLNLPKVSIFLFILQNFQLNPLLKFLTILKIKKKSLKYSNNI